MKLYSVLIGVLLALAAVSIAHSQVSMEIGIRIGPPPARYECEVDAPAPFPHAVWIRGHWMWNEYRGRYVWMRGHWVAARPSCVWMDGSWHRGPRGWGWQEGYWRRADWRDDRSYDVRDDDEYYDRDDRSYGKHGRDWWPGHGRGKALGHYKHGKH